MLDNRLQLLLDDDRLRRLKRRARERGTSVSAVIREAIDAALPDDLAAKRAAADRILAAEPVPIIDAVQEIREAREERARRFD